MTTDEVRARVEAIERAAGDWEQTHSLSDELWAEVLLAIGQGKCEDPAAVAQAAWAGVQDLNFTRWYA